ncbi:MAG: autotransporter domain-containing protein [Polaromonas sp.]|nr:autotransporter domain-containing protein [Polaromonas sp.]
MKKPVSTALAAALALAFLPAAQAQNSFEYFGRGSQWYINAISADGSTLAGQYYSGTWQTYVWTQQGGYTLLPRTGLNNGSVANGLSADGRVVVGRAGNYTPNPNTYTSEAYRWTADTGFEYLGTLGGDDSSANAVSADGNVIVGAADIAAGDNHAFRWTGGVMSDLGTLGGRYSTAFGASADGGVVVGSAQLASNRYNAFRWTAAGGMASLGTLSGDAGADSSASAVSQDGSVIVGNSQVGGASSDTHAFRWTQAGGRADLGTLGGNFSNADAVSADGKVVVGASRDAAGDSKAFRWSETYGMQAVDQWLAGAGVLVNNWDLQGASGTNADGSIVVGYGENGSGIYSWLARVSSYGSGVMQTANYTASLAAAGESVNNARRLPRLVIWGSHHRPLMTYPSLGTQNCFWATGDLAARRTRVDADDAMGEVGVCRDFAGGAVRAGLGLGYARQNSSLGAYGRNKVSGMHVVGEVNYQMLAGPLLSVTGVHGNWDADIRRAYAGASGSDGSTGQTGVSATAVRLRADWADAWLLQDMRLSPYAALTATRTRSDGYTETGGGFPARFDAKTQTSWEARLGSASSWAIRPSTDLRATLEGVHRLDGSAPRVSGQVLGLFAFDHAGIKTRQTWVRAGLDVDHRINPRMTVGLSLHAASRGDDPTLSAAATLRVGF